MAKATGVYLELFHGRKNRDEDMDDWGEQGPVFGPFDYFHTTYGYDIKFFRSDTDEDGCLFIDDGMVYYDGIWYGDWSVFASLSKFAGNLSRDANIRLKKFDQNKAKLPEVEDG